MDREKKEDQRIALICMVIANANRDARVKKKPYTIEDFMPKYEAEKPNLQAKVKAFQTIIKTI